MYKNKLIGQINLLTFLSILSFFCSDLAIPAKKVHFRRYKKHVTFLSQVKILEFHCMGHDDGGGQVGLGLPTFLLGKDFFYIIVKENIIIHNF